MTSPHSLAVGAVPPTACAGAFSFRFSFLSSCITPINRWLCSFLPLPHERALFSLSPFSFFFFLILRTLYVFLIIGSRGTISPLFQAMNSWPHIKGEPSRFAGCRRRAWGWRGSRLGDGHGGSVPGGAASSTLLTPAHRVPLSVCVFQANGRLKQMEKECSQKLAKSSQVGDEKTGASHELI